MRCDLFSLSFLVFLVPTTSGSGSGGVRWHQALRGGSSKPPVYENNGGTIMAVAGDHFAVLAADTRLSKGYTILSRNATRLWEVAPNVWLGIAGCTADVTQLVHVLKSQAAAYVWNQGRNMTVEAMAQLLSVTLYQRKNMPYYAFCILAGLDASGAGAVYSYDAIGSFDRVRATCVGGAQAIVLPILDQIVQEEAADETGESYFQRWTDSGASPTSHRPPRISGLTLEDAVSSIQGIAAAAAEREIRIGDRLRVVTINSKTGQSIQLRDVELKAH